MAYALFTAVSVVELLTKKTIADDARIPKVFALCVPFNI